MQNEKCKVQNGKEAEGRVESVPFAFGFLLWIFGGEVRKSQPVAGARLGPGMLPRFCWGFQFQAFINSWALSTADAASGAYPSAPISSA